MTGQEKSGRNACRVKAEAVMADRLWESLVLVARVHDDHWPGQWLCGRCPYMNAGPICTKCGAPCYEGEFVGGVVVS